MSNCINEVKELIEKGMTRKDAVNKIAKAKGIRKKTLYAGSLNNDRE
ncbi:hypothetical protein MCHI_000878 [Candidatus Magnetoovum chiemensis]|nr:hypothetical protein MCHI_000878 [Candidatus Magnetoovum chiemensis]